MAAALTKQGWRISATTVGHLLHTLGYSLQSVRKSNEGAGRHRRQDGVVIHSKSGAAVIIGQHTSIAHRSIVHGPCIVGDNVFIGFNSVVFNCVVGSDFLIRPRCLAAPSRFGIR